MSEENKLAFPQKIDIDSFPKEQKKKRRRKKSGIRYKIRKKYKNWQEEREWKKSQKSKYKPSLGEKTLIFLLAPIADFMDDIRRERKIKESLHKEKRPNFFVRLYLMYKENQEEAKESKFLSRKIRKSLSFDLDQDKRVFSFKDEYLHMKDTWKILPWNKSRELENMFASTFTILLAFSLNYLLIQGAKYGIARFFHIPALWQDGRIIFNIPDPSPLWTYSSVMSVYIIGPFLVFVVAMVFNSLHNKTKDKSSFKALLYLWLNLTAFILFFGTFVAGIFTDRGFGYVLGWLYIPKYIEIPLGIFSVFMIWMIGFSAGKKLIAFAPQRAFYTSVLPQFFIKILYIYIPVILSISILLLIGFNNRDFTIQLVYISFIGMLTPTLRFIPERME
ncbi:MULTISPECIES: hypothetical protein [unclassified Lentimicrobium]|uniref:hypothetical protein n=1 Tax=unclassified Lentimicrobium TaxID=2677434 RepID=UPI00155749C3|nr:MULTISPECIES: hypothetical protein [unclassified Lentimicrobium]NPD46592.1 hypothetical protein [Lentimicrobium sp. S6]NPD83811.1 hypothetical protein [Lentimicrobium sp. L6]